MNKTKIDELLTKEDNIEQQNYIKDVLVQIAGLSESREDKDDLKNVLKLAKDKLGTKLKSSDIKSVHCLGKKSQNNCRDLIVSFSDLSLRETFYQKRKNVAADKDPKKNIYVNDRITNHRKSLFYSARKLCKAKKVFAAWTQKGNVLIRKSENGAVIEIKNYKNLRNIDPDSDPRLSKTSVSTPNEDMMSHLSDYDYDDYFD